MAKQTKKSKKRNPYSIIALILCSGILLGLGFLITKELHKNKQLNEKLQENQTILVSKQAENKALESAISEGDEQALAEEQARKKGYVRPDERVYVDITPGSKD